MKRCWIHIGMHKTSSTSVQQNLKKIKGAKDWRLLDIGGRPNMGPALHAMFATDPSERLLFARRGQLPDQVAKNGKNWKTELENTIQTFSGNVCIISGEILSDPNFHPKIIVELREFLIPLFDEIFVFGYVRQPFQYKNSRFQERLKTSLKSFDPNSVKLAYRERFERFDEIFGPSNVILRKFDPSSFPGGCAVRDFCKQMDIDLPANATIRRHNDSLSQQACGILFAYRKFGPGYGSDDTAKSENIRLIRALQKMGGRKFKLSRSITGPVVQSEREDIEWMEHRLGESLAEAETDDGSEIRCEEDLLKITRASCEEFIKCFEEMYHTRITPRFAPKTDPVDPREVAGLVQSCREICVQLMRRKKEYKNSIPRWRRSDVYRRLETFASSVAGNFTRLFFNK